MDGVESEPGHFCSLARKASSDGTWLHLVELLSEEVP